VSQILSPIWQLGDAATPSLDQLISAFEVAYGEADWLKISQLNDYTQPCVEAEIVMINAATAAAGKDANSAMLALKPSLERLATIYQSMQHQCAAERDTLAAKLNEVNAGRSATEHYALTSSL
jgi:predicted RNA polymerase sigma factor